MRNGLEIYIHGTGLREKVQKGEGKTGRRRGSEQPTPTSRNSIHPVAFETRDATTPLLGTEIQFRGARNECIYAPNKARSNTSIIVHEKGPKNATNYK